MHRLALALLAAAVSLPAVAAPPAPAPAAAVYDVSRGGKVVGEATVRLREEGAGVWILTSDTRGTAGMARMLGLDVHEESHFRWRDGQPESLSYDYRQDAAIKHKQRHIDFDWSVNEARVVEGEKVYRYALAPGTVDRHAVTVAIGHRLLDGDARDIDLKVAVKDHIEDQRYAAGREESLRLPAGTLRGLAVERTDTQNKIRSWYAPGEVLPVRVEQPQKDGATIVMELKSRGGR